MEIEIPARFRSLAPFKWRSEPLSIITGRNGSGKTHFLLAVANTCGLSIPLGPNGTGPMIMPGPHSEGSPAIISKKLRADEVVFATSDWASQINSSPVTTRDLYQSLTNLLQQIRPQPGFPRQEKSPMRIRLERETGITEAEVEKLHSPEDLIRWIDPSYVLGNGWGGVNLSLYFLAYDVLSNDQKYLKPMPGVADRFGAPPWDVLSEIITAANLDLSVEPPPAAKNLRISAEAPYEIKFIDKEGRQFTFSELSSGEKVIVSTLMWTIVKSGFSPKLLLLDEPDAHLHPALAKYFIKVISEYFVANLGVEVIMTTHSATTVSFAPLGSTFKMSQDNGIQEIAKNLAVEELTDGLQTVHDDTRIVVLEGITDKDFYEAIRSRLIQEDRLKPSPALAFITSTGKASVVDTVKQIRALGYRRFHGVMDLDKNNKGGDGLHVLRRYSIENYLFDPLVLSAHLAMSSKFVVLIDGFDPRPPSIGKIAGDPELMQRICTEMSRHLLGDAELADVVDVEYTNGVVVKMPRWFIVKRGKDIESHMHEIAPDKLLRNPLGIKGLIVAFEMLGLIPVEFKEVFDEISGSPL